MLSILHRPLYTAFPNRLDRPVTEKGLRVSDPVFAVVAVVVPTKADDGGYLCVDDFAFLVGQAVDVWLRSTKRRSDVTAADL